MVPAQRSDLDELVKLIRELADFERLLDQVLATRELLEAPLFAERSAAEAVLARVGDTFVGFALYLQNFSTFVGRPGSTWKIFMCGRNTVGAVMATQCLSTWRALPSSAVMVEWSGRCSTAISARSTSIAKWVLVR